MDWANQEATRVGDSNCGGLFVGQTFAEIHNMFIPAYHVDCSDCEICVYFQTPTNPRISMFSLSLSRRPGLTAQLHKQSPVGTTRQLLCSRAAIPCRRHFLRKSARMVSSSFFSEKKKLKASKRLQRTLLGPQPKLQANAVLSKTAKCLARESYALTSAER